MSDDEVEKFEITDYDLEHEFNINRPTRRLTKHQQIYGIWADENGDEGGGGTSTRASFRGAVAGKGYSYTAPVSFVSGGIQQAGKKKPGENEKEKEEEEEEEEDSEDGEETRAGFGTRRRRGADIATTSSEEDEGSGLEFRHHNKVNSFVDGDIAGLRRKKASTVSTSLMQKGVGSWEKHTKGIGAKLLLQMGFQPGKGLGKDLQGISAPVEAHLRRGRGAIGAYGPEKGKNQQQSIEVVDSEEEEEREFGEKLSQWRRKDAGSKKRIRYVYKSVDDVLEQGKTQPSIRKDYSQFSKVKVIDMTGPQQRVLTGYHAIAGQQRPSEELEVRKDKAFTNFALPELQHNLNLLLDMCEQDIIQNDRRLRYTKDQLVVMTQEKDRLKSKVKDQEQQIEKLQALLTMIDDAFKDGNSLTLDKAAACFREVQDRYYEEYRMYELEKLACGLVAPLIHEKLKSWKALENPAEPIRLFQTWKDILEVGHPPGTENGPYQQLVWEAWMPVIRTVISTWNCRDCEPVINLLELWLPLLPTWVLENIREQLVLPRIQREVEEWNPVTDTVPIHAWIHPWLPLLGHRMDSTVFPVIRSKLSKALVNWHPSDHSARLMLQSWNAVFPRGDMEAFLVHNILPKLQLALQEMTINPQQQQYDQWKWVMDWQDLLPTHTMATLLERFFFPKWLQILTLWLSHNPNYEEVTNWYTDWKGMLSENLLIQPGIQEQFRRALEMMNRAVSMQSQPSSQPGAVESVSYLTNIEQTPAAQRGKERMEMLAEAVRTASQIPQGFKDLIQKRCEERGIIFVPLANRYREGKQIYRCGKVQVYLDRNVVFVSYNGGSTWAPTSLFSVLEMAA
ncbi:tuftelin-interacting protein 11 [Schistocerca cancellata]|uniref:tuftelin-interacting protein 11 n=1 Tax=Schistocerca cancellata TaxID=274614 RepID=UPI002118C938|nr:tuftelin-interacting protein 11 [Schistocerca cancellata]